MPRIGRKLDATPRVPIVLNSSGKPSERSGWMSSIDVPLVRGRFGQTARQDNWWLTPLLTFLGLSAFIVYSTWAAFQGNNYRFGPYLSPFYSPELLGDPSTAWFGGMPTWIP